MILIGERFIVIIDSNFKLIVDIVKKKIKRKINLKIKFEFLFIVI